MPVRIASFNVENLFARYRFRESKEPTEDNGFSTNDLAFEFLNDEEKEITAKAIIEVNADIIGLQEVESLPVLDSFNSKLLKDLNYKHRILVDGFDRRGIDVALMSRYPIIHIRTHRNFPKENGSGFAFSRDCLEVDIEVNSKIVTLYVNHFKSMAGGRDKTKTRREEQVKAVIKILDDRWKKNNYQGNFIVLGDLNDYLEEGTALTELIEHPGLVNVSDRAPEDDRWTHYWNRGNKYSQLDYVLLSPCLAEKNVKAPKVMRKGLPKRAKEYTGERFKGVGHNRPKASDHAPIYMDLELI